jgi:hypothetical protein
MSPFAVLFASCRHLKLPGKNPDKKINKKKGKKKRRKEERKQTFTTVGVLYQPKVHV